jgi:hypothetical protein
MAVRKRKAPQKAARGKLLAAALDGPDALGAFSKSESARYEKERINFLEGIALDFGVRRERFRSDLEWLYELAYRLASEHHTSTGNRGRPSYLSDSDLELWACWKKEEKTGASERRIAGNLVEIVQPWASRFAEELSVNEKKKPADRLLRHALKRPIADTLRKRYKKIANQIEEILGTKIQSI